jgi:hypothetical protein
MKKVFNWLIDKWLAGFITATIFFIAKVYYDLPENKTGNFWNFQWIKSVINYQIKFWIVFCIVVFLLLMFYVSRLRARQKKATNPVKELSSSDPLSRYTKDTFGVNKAKWAWRYEMGFDNKINIIDVVPICPTCNNEMYIDPRFSATYAECSKCRLDGKLSTYPLLQNPIDVHVEIIRRIRSKEFLQKTGK